jgi:hypothetical protein
LQKGETWFFQIGLPCAHYMVRPLYGQVVTEIINNSVGLSADPIAAHAEAEEVFTSALYTVLQRLKDTAPATIEQGAGVYYT